LSASSDDAADPQRAADFWDRAHGADWAADSLLAHPLIQGYMSLRAWGSTTSHMDVAIAEISARTRPGARLLSVACGAALKERDICRALPDREIVGIDLASATVERAREEAARAGLHNLHLEHGDCNALDLDPASFDMVLGLGAIHHIENLEGFWRQCRRALRPGGTVLAQEYVGPSRFQWTAEQIACGDEALRTLVPPEHQVHHTRIEPVPLAELIAIDPSEAVRSAEIIETCRDAGFTLLSYRGCGCSLLQPVLIHQTHTFDPANWDHNHVLFTLFEAEDRLIRERGLGDNYAMFVAG
jgi:SAM-dependent methyltransferase